MNNIGIDTETGRLEKLKNILVKWLESFVLGTAGIIKWGCS